MEETILIVILFLLPVLVGLRGFYRFVKENGWRSVKVKILDFLKSFLRLLAILLIVFLYSAGLMLIPSYFDVFLQSAGYTGLFIFIYLSFGVVGLWYLEGTKRRNTKDIRIIFSQDVADFKKKYKAFVQDIKILAKATLKLSGYLLIIGAIVLVFILFGWFIASLSATTIIITLLILILLK